MGTAILTENFDAKKHRESLPDPVQEASIMNREGIAENARRICELEQQVAELTDLVRKLTA